MSIRFVKPVDEKALIQCHNDSITNLKNKYDLWKRFESVMSGLNGKAYTKRIVPHIEAAFPGWYVSMRVHDYVSSIRLFKAGHQQESITFYLGDTSSNNKIEIEKIRESNSYENNLTHIADREKLDLTELHEKVLAWNTALKTMQDIAKWADGFSLEYSEGGFYINGR